MKIPLYIEFKGRRVLVVGGGSVGTRRALKFLEAGAEVKVASLWFTEELREKARTNERLSLLEMDAGDEERLREIVGWSELVVLATDNLELNERVARIARSMGRLVNNATNAADTDVVVPFEASVAGIRVAVTTEGRSGVVARIALERIKEMLERDVELASMLKAFEKAKEYMRNTIRSPKDRIPLYFKIEGDEEFRRYSREGLWEKAWMRAKEIIDGEIRKRLSRRR